MRKISILMSLLVLSACASPLKQRCESQDWNAFGVQQGEEGSVWSSDPYPGQCRGEGVNPNTAAIEAGYKKGLTHYCTVEGFTAAGVKGDAHSSAVCAPSMMNDLNAAYRGGIMRHCSKQGAFVRGKSGQPNLHVCPAGMQASYDVYYSQGKTTYLKGELVKRRGRLMAIDRETVELKKSEEELKHKLARAEYLAAKKDKSTTERLESVVQDTVYNLQNKIADNNKKVVSLAEEKAKIKLEMPDIEYEISKSAVSGTSMPAGELESY